MSAQTKIALVTGGSRGLGKNMAIKIAAKGIDVILTYRSNEDEANKTVKEIENIGQNSNLFVSLISIVDYSDYYLLKFSSIVLQNLESNMYSILS